jgi:tripartite-type tricarboxylate transporter receptor subunit TctC
VNAAFGIALPYDSFKDLAPVARFVDLPLLLAANNEAPFKSVAELLAGPKSGNTIAYASAGIGSIPHLWGEYLKARTGLPLEHVGYKGSAEALRDVMAGHVPLFSDVLMPTAAPVRAGKLRGLAVAMAERSALLPDVPTVGEAGLAGMEGAVPFGISTTGGTPVALVGQLNAAVNEALGDEGVRQKLRELGFIPIGGSAAFYAQSLAEETAKWRKVIEESKIPAPS